MADREMLFGIMPREVANAPPPCKSVFNPAVARRLLKLGHRIVDIKPHRKDRSRTVFLFERTEELLRDLSAL